MFETLNQVKGPVVQF